MKTLLYVSPLWPQKSGISDYSEKLVFGLKEYFDVTILTKRKEVSNKKIIENFEILSYNEKKEYRGYDAILYNFGNSPDNHDYMCDMLKTHPGYVILHDYTLYYLMVEYYRKRGELYKKIYQVEGKKKFLAVKKKIKSSRESNLLLHKELAPEIPLNTEILENACGVFVHSQYTKQLVCSKIPDDRVYKINIVDCMPEINFAEADYIRKKYRWKEDTFIIGAVGMIAPSKQNIVACKAIDEYNMKHDKKVKYVMIGEGECANEYLSENIKKTGFLSQNEFFDAIQSCNLIFNLRYPYNGESSASLVQCMLMGKPCVVTDIGWFGELPDGTVYKISEKNEISEVIECITNIISKKVDVARMAKAGKEYVTNSCNEYAVARSIAEKILNM